jgi:hypothetical protein
MKKKLTLQIYTIQEQILRLQMNAAQQPQSLSSKPTISPNPFSTYSPPSINQQQQLPIIYIIAAIVMAIFGVVLGKFIL